MSVTRDTFVGDNCAQKRPEVCVVCEAFHGPAPSLMAVVRHLNGIRIDNRADNLVWGTASENQIDRIRHGNNEKVNQMYCKRGHALSGDNVLVRLNRPGHRECITCKRQRDKVRYRKADA